MSNRRIALLLLSTALAVNTLPGAAQEDGAASSDGNMSDYSFAGYNKTLLISSHTLDEDDQRYSLALNRTRLKLDYRYQDWLDAHVENDTEVSAGDYLHTHQFMAQKDAPRRQYWNGESTWVDDHDLQVTNSFYRAYAKFSFQDNDTTIGRQRIPIGTGRMWSTLDMLNPINPLQIERDEYVGVDAIQSKQKLGALSELVAIYAPDPAGNQSRWIGQYRTHQRNSDITFTAGQYWQDKLIGLDFATQTGDAGLHGELVWTNPSIGPNYGKALLGFDYAFPNTFDVSVEAYYSQQKDSDRLLQFLQNPLLAEVEPFGSRYLGANFSYEFTPLFKGLLYVLGNLEDGSRFYSPILSYSLSDNLFVQAGMQFYTGGKSTDYGRGKNVYYAQTQIFF